MSEMSERGPQRPGIHNSVCPQNCEKGFTSGSFNLVENYNIKCAFVCPIAEVRINYLDISKRDCFIVFR